MHMYYQCTHMTNSTLPSYIGVTEQLDGYPAGNCLLTDS